ncbi:hypothetical protein FOC4_g10002038 [Fusarium odoratissimum]|uniref:Uncharacterized protein n=3 Tax=Fusarium oxysporum species complex TaxID=171631 RepID=N1SBU0_FUSC4|nr:hypothetical protein FOC4_g10002038 [Fusarium odoratissimum]
MAKRMAAESIMSGSFEQDQKDMAQQQHQEFCTQLVDLCQKQDYRNREMQDLKRRETRLSRQWQSAN